MFSAVGCWRATFHPLAFLHSRNSANPYRVATVMKGHFPRVHYYFCSQLGNLSVSLCGRRGLA